MKVLGKASMIGFVGPTQGQSAMSCLAQALTQIQSPPDVLHPSKVRHGHDD
jgi:hypothetical protein